MNNKTLGLITVLSGCLLILSDHESAWIISAIIIGIGSGIMFWKDKK